MNKKKTLRRDLSYKLGLLKNSAIHSLEIVLFKSIKNSKRRNKGNFTSKSN